MEKMSMQSRLEYLRTKKSVYLKLVTRAERTQMLDEICTTTMLNRKYVVSLLATAANLKAKLEHKRKKRQAYYDNQVTYYLKKIWNILDCPCGQRLVGVLVSTAEALIRHKEMVIPESIMKKLKTISSATTDRLLKQFKAGKRRRLHGTTKPGSLLKKQIPIQLSRYNVTELGHSEIDLCAHNGGNSTGDFANTLVDTDLSSGWTEQEAFLGKAQKRVKEALIIINERRPFHRKSIDSDTGGEFINWLLYNFCATENVLFTRGRPGKKNDNPHVEEKNWTHVRKLVGYLRYDTEHEVNLLNDLYRNEWRLYENFFQPTIKLVEKTRISGHLKKKYDTAQTPYGRVMASSEANAEDKAKLKKLYESLNPAELKRQIEKKIERLFQAVRNKKKQTKSTN